MRIVLLTQYYPPETGAPQNRLSDLAARLKSAGDEVEVWTAMPNYPVGKVQEAYRRKWFFSEFQENVLVRRSWIYATQSKSIIPRLLNYFSFVFSSIIRGLIHAKKADFILCESPPLFLGISAVIISKIKRAKLIFNVSDLWPESAEKLNIVTNKTVLRLAENLELYLYKSAFIVSGQTQGIIENIKKRSTQKNLYWLPNGVDPAWFNPLKYTDAWRYENGFKKDDILLLYAGIIGHAQGLDVIIRAAARLKHLNQVHWILVGDGPVKKDLQALKEKLNTNQVHFFGNQARNKMPEIVKACNATVVPLKKLPLFEGAIPSKIFENLAMEVPVILGVEGEAKELFINQGKSGLGFEPENDEELAACVQKMVNEPELFAEFGKNGRNYVLKSFDRERIALEFRSYLKVTAGIYD
jgi:glycosyltransferase involved in cell wall biosynthesis